eukprot:CAMPEP_0115238680 /NCGR_PEP_ID=MMETSP0270-20121206/37008_1 /TAXON_ID=71861 /ORGANISM="Scrippsiella trochoidea, Strain CCMP3099" /LENGTH=146 /DNA_ID=CAMNT_0002653615 /DNA_START=45 /DNA_END=483 /DNA_ORIENTATION=+
MSMARATVAGSNKKVLCVESLAPLARQDLLEGACQVSEMPRALRGGSTNDADQRHRILDPEDERQWVELNLEEMPQSMYAASSMSPITTAPTGEMIVVPYLWRCSAMWNTITPSMLQRMRAPMKTASGNTSPHSHPSGDTAKRENW